MDRTLGYTRANRSSWNAIAPDRPTPPPEFFRDGGSTLDAFEVEALPDVAGRRLLHLACANGVDSLSWAVRGASVTGVDISDVAVETANALASETGLDARFLAADLYALPGALPAGLGEFDIVYASWGVVCWLPDLDRWARIVVELLRPGGTFLLCEHHPIWEVLGVRPGGVLEPTVDYFGRAEPSVQAYDQDKRPTGSTPDTAFSAFLWPVSDVVSSLRRAGLRIERFVEAPVPEMYAGLGPAARFLPAVYVVQGTRDGSADNGSVDNGSVDNGSVDNGSAGSEPSRI